MSSLNYGAGGSASFALRDHEDRATIIRPAEFPRTPDIGGKANTADLGKAIAESL